jgi:hypothetical protein
VLVPRWPVPFVFPLRGGFVLPRGPGAVARAGPRAQSSDPPPHATEQERPALGPLAVRKKPTPATPHRGTPARDPHAPAQWLLSPAGRMSPPPPFATVLLRWCRQCLWAAGKDPRGGCQRPCLPRPRGPSVRTGLGCRLRRRLRTPRGPGTGSAAGSRPRESRSAVSGGEQATRGRAPASQDTASRSETTKNAPERPLQARGAKQRRTVKQKNKAAHHRASLRE